MSNASAIVKATWSERILVLTFSDPTSRNSFSLRAARELLAHLEENVGRFDAFVFRAEGRVFCSGGNLSDYAAMKTAEEGIAANREIRAVLEHVASWPEPGVCVVQGDAFGGGVELASAFDVVVSSPGVAFALWQRRIALSFGWGGGARLKKRLGESKLNELALSTRLVLSNEAFEIGLVDEIAPKSLVDQRALEIAKHLSHHHRDPLVERKTSFSKTPFDETELFERLWWSDEHKASLAPRRKK